MRLKSLRLGQTMSSVPPADDEAVPENPNLSAADGGLYAAASTGVTANSRRWVRRITVTASGRPTSCSVSRRWSAATSGSSRPSAATMRSPSRRPAVHGHKPAEQLPGDCDLRELDRAGEPRAAGRGRAHRGREGREVWASFRAARIPASRPLSQGLLRRTFVILLGRSASVLHQVGAPSAPLGSHRLEAWPPSEWPRS